MTTEGAWVVFRYLECMWRVAFRRNTYTRYLGYIATRTYLVYI